MKATSSNKKPSIFLCGWFFRSRCSGHTLPELLIVVSLLAMIAAIVLPTNNATQGPRLELAAQQVADAFRFAHSEAQRTGKAHGVYASAAAQKLVVYWWDESDTSPVARYTVYHPVDKTLYALQFSDQSGTNSAVISSTQFDFDGIASAEDDIIFAATTGLPKYRSAAKQLVIGRITLTLGGQSLVVDVSPMTGRVTIS